MNKELIYNLKRLMMIRYSNFASELANCTIEYRTNLKYHTAATDGKKVYFDPNYLASLTEEERLFVLAHELMHIKFYHALRYDLPDRNGNKRDPNIYNEAADAVINANLERDGFKIKEGYVNRPEALKYNVEEFYEILLKEKQQQENNNQNSQGNDASENNDSSEKQESRENIGDDHSLWEEASKEKEEKPSSEHDNSSQESQTSNVPNIEEIDEKKEFEENRTQRIQEARKNLERIKSELLQNDVPNNFKQIKIGDVGQSNTSIDWELFLRREREKTETVWSRARSIAENNYAYRLIESDIEDEAETEVMIDVSGSVDLSLVKAFLRIIKTLPKYSKLKVGTFNEKYWGMVEIKQESDIDNFEIPEEARGIWARTEDWDLAVRSFTRKREVNKLVFTDGQPCPGNMPKEDLKNENVLWFVYGNRDFKPCCGKVIHITEQQLNNMNQINKTR